LKLNKKILTNNSGNLIIEKEFNLKIFKMMKKIEKKHGIKVMGFHINLLGEISTSWRRIENNS